MSKKAWIEFAIGLSICLVAAALGVFIGARILVHESEKTLAEATTLVRTLHTGENTAVSCYHGEPYFVELFAAKPDSVAILVGAVSADIRENIVKVDSVKSALITIGCLAIKIVKDPNSLYMLKIYAPPGTK